MPSSASARPGRHVWSRHSARLRARSALVILTTLVAAWAFAVPTAHAGPDALDTAIELNGSSQSGSVLNATFQSRTTFSVEAWSRASSTACAGIACWIAGRDGDAGIAIVDGTYRYLAFYGYNAYTGWVDSKISARANEWTHTALVREGTSVRFYINGALVGTTTLPSNGAHAYADIPFRVGWVHGSNYFTGQIDEVRYWSTARTASEIQTDMHAWGPANASGLVAYWDFNEGSGAVAANRASGAASGTNLALSGNPGWRDVKSVARVGARTVVTFPRSYLTRSGGWQVPGDVTSARTLVVAGGGGGGGGSDNTGWQGGGGGAGGVRAATATPLTAGAAVPVRVGQGGRGWTDVITPTNGQDSALGAITATGGGRGGVAGGNGASGGSGGGGAMYLGTGGAATSGQGNAGGGTGASVYAGSGGGGAGGAGGNASGSTAGTSTGGAAGLGLANDITGTSTFYAGGGAGRGCTTHGAASGSGQVAVETTAGANTGSGGGAGGDACSSTGRARGFAGAGGSGVVIVSYESGSASLVGYDFNKLPSTVTTAGSSGRPFVSNGQLFLASLGAGEWGTAHFPVGANAAPSTWRVSFYHQQAGGTGADGTSMWFAPTPVAYSSYGGVDWTVAQAYEDAEPSTGLAIQFDKFDSGRLGIFWNGTQVYSATGYGAAYASGSNVTVSYDANGLDFSGFGLTVTDLTLANYASTVTSRDWQVSFGARTGGANDNHVIDDLSIRANGSGVTLQDDRSRSFNGSTDYIGIPDNSAVDDGTFSFEGWFKPSTATGDIVRKENSFAIGRWGSGDLQYTLHNGSAWGSWISTGVTVPSGVWTHIALVKDGTTVRVHINGNPTPSYTTSSATSTVGNSSVPYLLGMMASSCTGVATPCPTPYYEQYSGLMDQVRIWNGARTGAQIAATYATRLASDSVTLAMDEPAGSIAYNSARSTGSAGNATIFGTSVSTDVPPIDDAVAVDGAGSASAFLPAATDAGSLTFARSAQATAGTATISDTSTGAFTYTPTSSGTYVDGFAYTVTNGTVTSSARGVQVSVTDTTAPLTTATAPATSTSPSIAVGYTVTAGTSDVASVAAFYSTSASLTSPTECGSVTSTAASGTITCALPSVSGTYYVYTRATDGTGNVEAAPGSADATTVLDAFVGVPTDASRTFAGSDSVGILDQNALDLSASFTFETWVKPSANTVEAMLINKELAYEIAIRSGVLAYALMSGGAWDWTSTGITVPTGTWTHLAFVKSGTTVRVHVNGAATASFTGAAPASMDNSTRPLTIGARGSTCTTLQGTCGTANYLSFFQGQLSDVRLWSSARSGAEIAAAYDKRLASDLLTWFLDETGGSTAYNSAMAGGSALNGTYAGTTTSTDVPTMSAPTTVAVNSASSYSGYLPGYEPGGSVTFAVGSQGTKGTVAITSATGAFTYTPLVTSSGLDAFTYTMTRNGVTSGGRTIGATIADTTAPTVSSFTSAQATPTNATSISYTLTFSESVTGVAVGDFSNSGTATGCAFDPGTDSGSTRTVTITGCGDGTIIPRFAASGASDASDNTGPASAAIATTTITRDATAPTVSSFTSAQATPTNATSLSYTLTFSESVTGVAAGDFTNTGTATGCVFSPGTDSGTTRTVTVTSCSEGTVIPRFAATGAADAAGNTGPAAAATSTSTITRDTTAPTLTLAASPATSSTTAISFTLTGGEPIDCTTLSTTSGTDFTLTNISALGTVTQTSSTVCTVTATSTATTGERLTSTLTRASSFSVTDTAGNAQTAISSGSPASVDVTRSTGATPTYPGLGGGAAVTAERGTATAIGSGFDVTDATSVAWPSVTATVTTTGGTLTAAAGDSGATSVSVASNTVTIVGSIAAVEKVLNSQGTAFTRIANAATGSATVTVAVQPTADQGTVNGSKTFFNAANGHYYRLHETALSYADASSQARADSFAGAGGYLAVVRDQAEDDFVRGTILARASTADAVGGQIRLGAVRCASLPSAGALCPVGAPPNVFAWSPGANAPAADTAWVTPAGSGSQSGWTPWYGGEPGNGATEAYLSYFYIGNAWRWHDSLETSTYTLREYGTSTSFTAATTTAAVTFADTTAPTVSSFTNVTSTPTDALTVTYTLTFSESVTGVEAGDFTNTGTATGCTFDPGADSGATRTVTISGCSDGTVIPRFASGGASDGSGNTGPATAATGSTLTIARNVAPTLATPTTASYTDTSAADTFANATGTLVGADANAGDTLAYGISGGTDGGTTVAKAGTYGTLTVTKSSGAYTFAPSASAINGRATNATETFTVTVSDGTATTNATFTVSITAVNDLPVVAAVSVSLTDTAAADTFSAQTGTLTATDAEGSAISAWGITGGTTGTWSLNWTTGTVTFDRRLVGTYGTLYVEAATGRYRFEPNATAVNALTGAASESLPITALDAGGATGTGAVAVSATGVNDTPTLSAVTGAAYTDTAANDTFSSDTGTLAGADRDAGATLSYGITGGSDNGTTVSLAGTYGTLTVTKATGAYAYAPNASAINARTANASDSFTVTVSDGTASTSQTYTVSITAANDTPTLSAVTGAAYTDTAANDTFSSDTGTLAGADRDAGASLTYGIDGGTDGGLTVSRVGAYGTLVVTKASGAYTYTPSASAINALATNATDTFTVSVSDGTASATRTYTVTLTGANDAPTLSTPATATFTDTGANDSFTSATGSLGGADRDAVASLAYGITGGTASGGVVTKAGAYGTLTVDQASGAYTYAPDATAINARTANDADTFTVTVSDGTATGTATFTASITGANDTPTLAAVAGASYTDTAANDTFSSDTGTLVGADRDTGATLAYGITGGSTAGGVVTKAGTYGTLTVNASIGSYTYAPSASAINALSANATDTFTVSVSDGTATTTTTYVVSIAAVNDTPTLGAATGAAYTDTAADDTFTVASGTLAGGDRDTGATLTYGISGGQDGGTTVSSIGTYGTLTVTKATGAYTFTPNASAINARTADASESFTVTVSDGAASTTQTYGVTITGVNDTPTLAAPTAASYTDTDVDDAFSSDGGTLVGADRDTGASLTYGIDGGSAGGGVVTRAGTYGTLTVNQATGAYTYAPSATAINRLTSNASDTFTVTVSDGTASASRTYTASVTAANDTPILGAVNGVTYIDTGGDDTFTSDQSTLTASDRDSGTTLTYGITGGSTTNGVVTKAGTYGTLVLDATTGAYTYTPAATAINARTANDYDDFQVSVTDGTATVTRTYSVSIRGANDTPTLAAVATATYTDTSATDTFSSDTGTLSGADRDTGASLTYGITGGSTSAGVVTRAGAYGTLTVNQTTGAYSYAPNAAAINGLSSNAADSFTVTVSDGTASATRTYQVVITAANDAPTLATPATAAFTDTAANDAFGDVAASLAGADGDTGAVLTYGVDGGTDGGTTVTAIGPYGTLTVTKATGAYTFAPNASAINARTANAIATFTVTVSDGTASANATLTVTVTAANDTPTLVAPASGSYVDTAADDAFSSDGGTLSAGDRDAGQTLTFGISGGTDNGTTVSKTGAYGTLTVTKATGAYTYAPSASAINARTTDGSDQFTVTVGDGTASATAAYAVAITGVNDTPTLASPAAGAYVDTAANDTFANDTGTLAGGDRDTGASLTYGITGGTDDGTAVSKVGAYGTLTVTKATGAYAFAPNAAAINALTASTSETFTVRVTDGTASATATYTVTITAANDGPTLATPATAAFADTAGADTFADATGTLVGADRDGGATLAYAIPGGVDAGTTVARTIAYGTLTVTKATGAYAFAPNAAAINARTADDTATITVRVSDGTATTDATFTVQVTGANDTPSVTAPSAASYTDTAADDTFPAVTGSLVASDRDSGQTLSFATVGGSSAAGRSSRTGALGVLSVDEATGAYEYAPNRSALNALTAAGSDALTLRVSDGTATADAAFTVNAVGANDTPTLTAPAALAFTDTTANDVFANRTGTFSGADRDAGATLVYGITGGSDGGSTVTAVGTYGTLVVTKATGEWVFTPNRGAINRRTANAAEQFEIVVSDGVAGAGQALQTTIAGSPETPVVTWSDPAAIWYPAPVDGTNHLNAVVTDATTGAAVPGTIAYSTVGQPLPIGTVLGAGTHTLLAEFTPTGATAVDYTTTTATVTLVVHPEQQTIAVVAPATREYGDAVTTLSASGYTGSGTITYAVVGGPCAINGAQLTTTGVGDCDVRASITADPNHAAAQSPTFRIAITQALLTVTADPKTKRIATADPSWTYQITGFQRGDSASVLTAPVQMARAPGEAAGTYALTPSGAAAANYRFAYVPALLTIVDREVPTLAWTAPEALTYGTPLSSTQLAVTATYGGATVPGTFSYTTGGAPLSSGTLLPAGDHILTATFTPTDAVSYASGVTTQVTLTVRPRDLTVTGVTAADKDYDGQRAAVVRVDGAALVGVVGSDDVGLDATQVRGLFDAADPGEARPVLISGLALVGVAHTNYRVVPPSATATIRAVVPGAPTDASATAGSQQATVTWSAPTFTGGVPITGYTVTASPGGQTCSWSGGPLSCTVTGLANGTAYAFAVRAINAVGAGPASTATASVTPAATVEAIDPEATSVLPNGSAAVQVGCAASARECRATVTLFSGAQAIASGTQSIAAGSTDDVVVALPIRLQRRLAAEGTLQVRAVTVIDIDGSTIRVESTITLTAPPAEALMRPTLKVAADGSSLVSGACAGTAVSRCDGTLVLYADPSSLAAPTGRAAERVAVASTRLAGPAGSSVSGRTTLSAQGRKLLARHGSLRVTPVITLKGSTRLGAELAPFTITRLTEAEWLRRVLRTLRVGGPVRVDLNNLLYVARGNRAFRPVAANRIEREIIPAREQARARAAALPLPPARLQPIATLLLRAFDQSLMANHAYVEWLRSGRAEDTKGWRFSLRATQTKQQLMARLAAAGARHGIRVPQATNFWP